MINNIGPEYPRILVAMPKGEVRDTFMPSNIIQEINKLGDVEWNNSPDQYTSEELENKLAGKHICICGWNNARFDKNVLRKADSLKLIAYTAGSVAHIVSDAMYQKGIKIVSANDCFAESVAESVMAYIFSSLRDIPYWTSHMQAGGWKSMPYYNEGIFGKTVGLVGFGATTRYLLNMLKPFKVDVKLYSNHIKAEEAEKYDVKIASLDEIFSTCNIISLHASLRPETYNMINDSLIKMIPDRALLINTARGGIIDEDALADELQKGRFRAVLDVYKVEPLPMESKLRNLRNTILMPHMGGPTIDRRITCTKMIIEEIERFLHGSELQHEVGMAYASVMTH